MMSNDQQPYVPVNPDPNTPATPATPEAPESSAMPSDSTATPSNPYEQANPYTQPQPQYNPYEQQTPAGQPQYAQPSYGGQQPYAQQYNQAYGQQQYAQSQYGQTSNPYTQPQYGAPQYGAPQYGVPSYGMGYSPKSKLAAGLLGIFLGGFGVHNFYLGNTGKAIAQLLLTLVGWILLGLGPLAATIWGLVEGILILTSRYGSPWHQDANGQELTD
ncbi:TM2 domain protein [Bifidobacterium saguini DSM 23967]|uniref:TM2 domain protein n=2 Tax=Bifidobacterium saguini TaxID=762210 RepID=A0A087DC05_9BIFI|nr:TM2 domain-containing protein [Bifidobacterium saguini]KFI93055.1 TM2 domain protein [Bifidobacterium saguini DSM 23967]